MGTASRRSASTSNISAAGSRGSCAIGISPIRAWRPTGKRKSFTTGEWFTLVSMYGAWERPLASASSDWIYADASAHRVVSNLSVFLGQQRGHRIVAAGDLNILHGHGEHGSAYWAARYQTVFDRMTALGLRFVGPQAPNGRQAEPWPDELPRGSRNVATFRTNQQTPAAATRQLDFVFASAGIADRVVARALNAPDAWGPSDHCRIEIEIGHGA